jgi:hypothetical protein
MGADVAVILKAFDDREQLLAGVAGASNKPHVFVGQASCAALLICALGTPALILKLSTKFVPGCCDLVPALCLWPGWRA